MALSSSRNSGRPPSRETQAVFDLLLAVVATFFKLRAVGQRGGSVNAWGGGTWGLLHSLETGGPQTVPQLARDRNSRLAAGSAPGRREGRWVESTGRPGPG